ncbi:hypothetical protein [Sandaracinobacteroides hominis]|uniref:hypothetical protein n=1 Tax=Sandaracinobacteroides hominis TaxID=2780086 RepID=UPI0018F524DC|nr:hypothetical protein [Sandaracinobacteroides hominis]
MSGIEVFQDMVLTGPESARESLALALMKEVVAPWRFDPAGSERAERNALGDKGILIFERKASAGIQAARLVLWPRDEGYYVPNITPAENGELGITLYNRILSEFAETIAKPVARRFGFVVSITSSNQDLDDWLDHEAAVALRRFSGAANKSTGASHPMDERRWFDFIIAVHRSGKRVGTDHLARWLEDVEGWDERSANKLASEFERGMALLEREAETR